MNKFEFLLVLGGMWLGMGIINCQAGDLFAGIIEIVLGLVAIVTAFAIKERMN